MRLKTAEVIHEKRGVLAQDVGYQTNSKGKDASWMINLRCLASLVQSMEPYRAECQLEQLSPMRGSSKQPTGNVAGPAAKLYTR